MLALLYATLALAQSTVVAMGDGVVAGPPAEARARAEGTVPWVTVLADCLEERSPRAWTVVDRAVHGDTAQKVLTRVDDLGELKPAVVVVGVGARELAEPEAETGPFRQDVDRLVTALRATEPSPGIVLLGLVPPTLAQSAAEQRAADRRTREWNGALAAVAGETDGVHHVDLQADWPGDGRGRSVLTVGSWRLNDQGHARVAAALCDTIVEAWPTEVSADSE